MAVVLAAGAGYWFLTPKMPNELVSTVQQTSLLTPLERSQTSTESTILASATTVNYYLSLLESNGSQPYVQLAKELRKLPDLKNATAVAKITYLALNATNPEVREAFQLMIKGGTPDPRDFTYTVPKYNTELQVLYWLACQNEFTKDDTLTLAIALVNGIWVTTGSEEVLMAVQRESSELISYFRNVDLLQAERNYYRLSLYPLEAQTSLVWTGGYSTIQGGPYYVRQDEKTSIERYLRNTIRPETLLKMQKTMLENGWLQASVDQTVASIENYFIDTPHWNYSSSDTYNINWNFELLEKEGHIYGNCGDESLMVDAFAKSSGISTTFIQKWHLKEGQQEMSDAHMHVVYYEPTFSQWRAAKKQLGIVGVDSLMGYPHLYLVRPPIDVTKSLEIPWPVIKGLRAFTGATYVPTFEEAVKIYNMLLGQGIPTVMMKQWLLYS